MNEDILKQILIELVAIRELLAKGAAAPAARPASQFSTPSAAQQAIPQPSTLVSDPDSVVIFFGKNSGKKLSEVSERSLDWYASVKDARLDSSGKPYPPKPADVALENAARQIHHRRMGTLNGGTPETRTERPAAPPTQPSSGAAGGDEENIPFAARYYDHG